MGRRSWIGIALLVLGLVVGAVSSVPFSRASETGARIEGHLAKAEQAARDADAVKESDPARYDELTQEARRWAGFAETGQEEQSTQQTGAWAMAGGAFVLVAAGALVFATSRRRPASQADPHKLQYR
ncbi:hypothetical protein [Planomonospora venezuelensis]|uniref:Drug/metabolite transporter (DMT)-like permease n=1 Tax=Planomonospora venezuelensis TaxID=1999 RepID=A0A841CVI2_PLAVE|nr:hypothetical protein [Planomonospora venezuelensis]MBB5962402.1 drug/metabolite transporter (DMT)-like permease [Planomonospora venezuelensis]GIN00784.1 hypothetical protein Pve01_24420 [Planomonospora venezuelensis]